MNRTIKQIIQARRQTEGGGFQVRRPLPASATATTQLLLLGGVPLGESVVQQGPFVMNTREEIEQAIEDYQQGRMGAIPHG